MGTSSSERVVKKNKEVSWKESNPFAGEYHSLRVLNKRSLNHLLGKMWLWLKHAKDENPDEYDIVKLRKRDMEMHRNVEEYPLLSFFCDVRKWIDRKYFIHFSRDK